MQNSGEWIAPAVDTRSAATAAGTAGQGYPPASLPAPGWYPDPVAPGRERWWSGERWTEFDHRAARSSLYPPEYVRSHWRGANHHARNAYWLYLAATALVLGTTVAVWVIGAIGEPVGGNVGIGLLSTYVVGLGFTVVAFAGALRALRAAPRLGAFGLAVTMIVGSAVLALWALGGIALLVLPVVL